MAGMPGALRHTPKVSTTQLGRYPIEAELGRGAMGVVYRSTHPRLDIPVAIKVLAEQYSSDLSFRQRFHREAATGASASMSRSTSCSSCCQQSALLTTLGSCTAT